MNQSIETTTILIVDDMPSNLGVVVNMLEDKGYRVSIAQDGEEALQRAQLVQPGLILLDVMMPGMDGFELCRQLKQRPATRHIPVIFMTALVSSEHKVKGFEVGGIDYITKPLQIDEVLARVGTHLKLHAVQQRLEEQNRQLEAYRQELEQRVAERTEELTDANRQLLEEIEERKRTQERLALVDFALNQVGEAAYLIGDDACFRYVNDEACRVLGYSRETLLTMNLGDISLDWPTACWEDWWCDLKRQGGLTLESRHRSSDDRVFPVEINATYFDYQGIGYSLALVRDISQRKRQEAQERTKRLIFEALAQGGALQDILNWVVSYVEQVDPDCIGSIMLLDADGKYLQSFASPSLPDDFAAAVDGIAVGEGAGSCGTAVSRGETVIADDVSTHPYWAPYRDLALRFGLWACWSEPIFDSAGKVLGTFGIYRRQAQKPSQANLELLRRASHFAAIAIERRQIEQRLLASERKFRSLAENSPDIIARYDKACRRIYFNRRQLEIAASGALANLGKTSEEFGWLVSPSADEYIERLQRVMDSGEEDELLLETRDVGGAAKYYMISMVPEYDDHQVIVSVLTIGHDVTGVKRMEAMLRKSELEFRTLAENSPDIIVRYDLGCRRVYINPAYERETGIPLETAWLKTPTEVLKPTISSEEYMRKLQRVMVTGQPERMLIEWQGVDGKVVSIDMHAVAEYDQDGGVVGVLVMGHNVTELKDTERRLKESQAQLRTLTAKREEAREEERKRIAREIHDELGQLLNVLRLNVTTLDFRYGDSNPDLRNNVQKMVNTVDRAIQMVRHLATRLRPAALNAGIVAALEWLLQEFSESTGIISELHLSAEDIHLDEDRAMAVFRIVQESLTNVLRHAEADRVDIFMRSGVGICEVEVRDNGKGFDPNTAVKTNSYGIVGMRERALILKGSMDIFAAESGGTVLRLRIPVDEDENTGIIQP